MGLIISRRYRKRARNFFDSTNLPTKHMKCKTCVDFNRIALPTDAPPARRVFNLVTKESSANVTTSFSTCLNYKLSDKHASPPKRHPTVTIPRDLDNPYGHKAILDCYKEDLAIMKQIGSWSPKAWPSWSDLQADLEAWEDRGGFEATQKGKKGKAKRVKKEASSDSEQEMSNSSGSEDLQPISLVKSEARASHSGAPVASGSGLKRKLASDQSSSSDAKRRKGQATSSSPKRKGKAKVDEIDLTKSSPVSDTSVAPSSSSTVKVARHLKYGHS
ncbi:hypothetical protein RQP46_008097 [Phenoliferia psychrophenolica]